MLLKLIVNGTQVLDLFQCQIKYAFVQAYHSSIDVHNVSNNEIEKLHGSRTQQATNIKLLSMSKMTYMYIMCFLSLLPVLKNHQTLSVYRGHVRQFL